jgi:hypothetical protein
MTTLQVAQVNVGSFMIEVLDWSGRALVASEGISRANGWNAMTAMLDSRPEPARECP